MSKGTLIGTAASGAGAIPNVVDGVDILDAASSNTVGGTTALARNVISGNLENGVEINAGTSGNVVEGDFIGTDSTGTIALGNGYSGVYLFHTLSNTIGGSTAVARDVISGNLMDGVQIVKAGAATTFVEGDYIGTDTTGTHALGNGRAGVYLLNADTDVLIGGQSAGAGNVISGNQASGVIIDAGCNGNYVEGNLIGTDRSGSYAVPNAGNGVLIDDDASSNDAEYDVISGNGGDGVLITGTGTECNIVAYDNIGLTPPAMGF